jgi:hypothetical protein
MAVPKSFPPFSEFASTKGVDCQELWRVRCVNSHQNS